MTPSDSTTPSPKELLNELQKLVAETEKMIGETVGAHSADTVHALRRRFDAAEARLHQLCGLAKQQILASAKSTDQAIRANPYQALVVVAGIGLLVGILLGRRNR